MKKFAVLITALLFLLSTGSVLAAPIAGVDELNVYYTGLEDLDDMHEPPEKVDMLLVVAHPDDDLIYMGGVIPYYGGELKKSVLVVYMSNYNDGRKNEAREGLKVCKNNIYPLFAEFPDKLTKTLEDAKKLWAEEETVGFLVSVLRKYRPDVVVTHDANGEYGHGAHMLTSLSVRRAVEKCADDTFYPQSAQAFGTYEVKKLYLHLGDNRIKMDWNVPLQTFEGKTALDIAKEAFLQHESQQRYGFKVTDEGPYTNAEFTLSHWTVDCDPLSLDFFEGTYPLDETHEDVSDVFIEEENVESLPEASPAPSPTAPALEVVGVSAGQSFIVFLTILFGLGFVFSLYMFFRRR